MGGGGKWGVVYVCASIKLACVELQYDGGGCDISDRVKHK
jgi:hypothetical protein